MSVVLCVVCCVLCVVCCVLTVLCVRKRVLDPVVGASDVFSSSDTYPKHAQAESKSAHLTRVAELQATAEVDNHLHYYPADE